MIKTYTPIILTLILVLFLTIYTAQGMGTYAFLQYGLGFFFLIFGYFKCMDLKGFADYFREYDYIAQTIPTYAFIYPFIEIAFGLAYLFGFFIQTTAIITVVLVLIRGIGIIRAMRLGKPIMCGCMGTTALFPINWATICANIATIIAAIYVAVY